MEPLQVDVAFFYPAENAEAHKTKKYEVVNDERPTEAVVRRGQPFSGVVRFNRLYEHGLDVIQMVFRLGGTDEDPRGEVTLERDVVANKDDWTGRIVDVSEDNSVIFEISTPITAAVGCWELDIITSVRDESGSDVVYEYRDNIYILFNPWHPDDQTYMEDCMLLQEYVQNDVGKVWVGPIKGTRGKPWLYGQFDAVVLPACMLMLDRAGVPYQDRGDPVKMTRAVSRIVNSNDDDGVLIGRWDGQYEDGTAPSEWTGSVDILQQFLETQAPVPYGQCWVFAGVVTTVCRALGIPSRVVSNLVSAHDANGSLSLDKFYTEDMEELLVNPSEPDAPADSIWNYHVWNDVWMARPDLPIGYGGWQAIDATPQETSAGFFQCGPAPLEAIKQGVTGVDYDVQFMLSSVNADLLRWRVDPTSDKGFCVVDTNNYHIGRMVLTKKPYVFDPIGDEDRQDITDLYKHREGSASERLALMNGVRRSDKAKDYYSVLRNMKSDVSFRIVDIDTVSIGRDFRVAVEITNNSDEDRTIKAVLSATSVYYTGVRADVIKRQEGKIFVRPGKFEEISILVSSDEYLPKLVEYCNIKISAMAIVDETKQSWADDDDFQILKPNIHIKFNEDLILNETATAFLSFTNPLDVTLQGCSFRVTSGGIAGRTLRGEVADVAPKQRVGVDIPVLANKLGKISIVATFTSDQLKDISGAATVEVLEG